MKGNETLAGYDMVLALSQNTINYQFSQLHKRNIIHKKWGVLGGKTTNNKNFHITDQDAGFKQKINDWIAIQKEIEKARAANNWTEIGNLMSRVQSENLNFTFGWDAVLLAPEVSFIKDNTKEVFLELRFKSGKLYYREEETKAISIFDLKDALYVFKVPIGQLKVSKENMIMDAGESAKTIIRESGLSDEDFTIQSLFLNFENANISSFDATKSKLPEGSDSDFQNAIANYFNMTVAGSNNPYVLGYGMHRKKIKASEKAMFQPTSLTFSTSYSNKNKQSGVFSALNFLMMLNDTKPPTSTTAGILPHSLIELGKDTSSSTDGVFSIQQNHFNTYLDSLDAYVQKTFTNLDGVELQHGFENGVMKLKKHDTHKDDTIDTVYTITKIAATNNSDNTGIKVRYKIEISVDVIVKAWFLKVGEKTLSTSGQYTKDEIKHKGSPGYLDFTIKAGKTGRFDLDHNLIKPNIAFDENPNLFGNGFWKDLLNILSIVVSWVIIVVNAIVTQITVDLGKDSASSSGSLIDKLNDIDVLNQTNKVILPLGKVYAFKNLRMDAERDIVAYDIAYAPVIEK
ncbi:hypothetical protein C8N46_11167 [Kordia periserrulae]|uniref:Uncharacterized protein n=1 Tax=Kordia periserrulae TaxID=701523 RepID=A0A2T6BSD8_9FLAO|nr:hypothetical protein [Kordia periserrulae]PTX58998.1 hypothetical protein C8N46_11167 [Kordia periserrulae]